MDLKQRITMYIIKNAPVTMDTILEVAISKGFTELEVLTALDTVHKDKRITQTATNKGVVTYKRANAKKTPVDHLAWLRHNYPTPDPWNLDSEGNFIEPFPEWDLSWIVLSPTEAKEYHARMKGINVWQQKRTQSNLRR